MSTTDEKVISVRNFGGFSARYGGVEIAKGTQGESQVGMLMLLLMHFGKEGVPRSLLKTTLFEDRDIEDVSHAIRNVLYNLRKQLRAGGLPDASYIKQKKGVYYWTDEVGVVEEARVFEEVYEAALDETDPEKQCAMMTENCYRYSGRFLQGMDSVIWIYQEQERYRDIFHECMDIALDFYREKHMFKNMYDLAGYAVSVDPFSEWEVAVMESLTGLGRYGEAERYYDATVDLYIKEYGNRHNDYVKDIIRKLGEHLFYRHESIDVIQEKLRNDEDHEGRGYYCSLPVFQELYRTVERTMERSGEKIFLMLCTIIDSKGNPMREGKKLDELSERLKEAITSSVRYTDTVTKYGQGQYLVLLINTTRENCSVVEKRINSKFIIKRQRTGIEFSINGLLEGREIPVFGHNQHSYSESS